MMTDMPDELLIYEHEFYGLQVLPPPDDDNEADEDYVRLYNAYSKVARRYIPADIAEELAEAVAQYDNVTGSHYVGLARRILQWTENDDD